MSPYRKHNSRRECCLVSSTPLHLPKNGCSPFESIEQKRKSSRPERTGISGQSPAWWFQPLRKVLNRWDYFSQCIEQRKDVPNHQPVSVNSVSYIHIVYIYIILYISYIYIYKQEWTDNGWAYWILISLLIMI